MAVVADHQLVLVSELAEAARTLVRNLGGDGARAEIPGELELVVDDGVGHVEDVVHLDDLDQDAGILEALPERTNRGHRRRQPPLLQFRLQPRRCRLGSRELRRAPPARPQLEIG